MKQKDSKNLFKLKKFQTVAPRTNTYSKKGAFSEKAQALLNSNNNPNEEKEENIQNLDLKETVPFEENQEKPLE